ncbi:MAG: M23 family metallopeptidase [Alphaproteobacteria bacterium]|nr:M23 family metallopeptidase [Alphaproteobacteria bacterium]
MSTALGACSSVDGVLYGARQGTIEYPGSGAGPGAAAVYVVKDRDTVDSIAQRYGVSTQTIVDRNRLQPPYQLRSGQTLEIPGARVIISEEPPTTGAPPPAAGSGPIRRENLAPPAGGQPTALTPSGEQVSVPATPPPKRFEWPMRGRVLANYGPTASGAKNDGIDIQADKGSAVKASDSGSVVYAGNEVRGMGNLVLVSHSGGYITAYGYNDSLLVKKGDAVKKGQTIAKSGASGGGEPRLHFEVRRGNRTLDPMTVLPQ